MKITVLCSSPSHPVYRSLREWTRTANAEHEATLVHSREALSGGDILFLVSCTEIITAKDRALYAKTLVLHASDLPEGRGWSPHIWQILNGASEITVTLLEAEDKVDTGDIWHKITAPVPKDALWDEINHILFTTELALMDYAIAFFTTITPQPQNRAIQSSYYPKRQPEDSRIEPHKTIANQFDLLRACDPDRFPAFFELRGARYTIRLEKTNGT